MIKQVHLIISGMVQGVLFRASAQNTARKLNVSGFVKNLSDGSVELIAQGEEAMLNRLIEWSRKGPLGARVENVEITWQTAEPQFKGFNIRY